MRNPTYVVPSELERITDLDAAWRTVGHGPRLRAVRRGAERLRERFAFGPRVISVRTLPIASLPYPTRFAFGDAAWSPMPWVVLTHRCLFVQFFQRGRLKNLLFNPTDLVGARRTPFFRRVADRLGNLGISLARHTLARRFRPIEDQLADLGIHPNEIDYLAFDHLHAQDLRPLIGTEDGEIRARFPNASLLVPEREWADWDDPHPTRAVWLHPEGKRDLVRDRVVLIDGDWQLGDGIMLLRTPGRTSGHQTLFISTDQGIWGCGGNGACADAWSPLDSNVPCLANYCRVHDVDLVMNGGAVDRGADQYTSMVLERILVDRVRRAPAFVQMFPSSEVTPSLIAPALKPTLLHRAITSGQVAIRATTAAA